MLLLIAPFTQIPLAINTSLGEADTRHIPSKKNPVKGSGNQGHPKKAFVTQAHQTTA